MIGSLAAEAKIETLTENGFARLGEAIRKCREVNICAADYRDARTFRHDVYHFRSHRKAESIQLAAACQTATGAAPGRPSSAIFRLSKLKLEVAMPRNVRCALIQASNALNTTRPLQQIRKAMIDKHLKMIEQAARKKAQILCLQELFYGPYFCAEQNARWYELTERVPDGPTTQLMQKLAAKYKMVMVVPVYEEHMAGVYFNTAAVIDADGRYLGKYRKHHLPHCHPGFWEKFYFTSGDLGYPVFQTEYAKVGVYICYDRHFPEGARCLGLNGAEIVFNPSATVAGLSEYLWELEQPAHAVANGYFVGAINRVGREKPWNIGEFYGKSYFCNPRGKIIAQASRNKDEVVVADLDLDMITDVRKVWQFFRDRRPETYGALTTQSVSSAAAD